MNDTSSYFPSLSSMDFYYISIASGIFSYGYIVIMTIGLTGNLCQMITFSRKTMRSIGTGILFLALSVSDTIYILDSFYVIIVYGFNVPDNSDFPRTCRLRHYFIYLSSNFSPWMLTIISCDRWIRSKFPFKAQQLCSQRSAIYSIIIVLIIDCLLHAHILTPMFGQVAPGVISYCGANSLYPTYGYFYTYIWPFVTVLTVNIIPAMLMTLFLIGIILSLRSRQNRIQPLRQSNLSRHENRHAPFLQREMFLLMIATVMLFFCTTSPNGLFRITLSTTSLYESFSYSLFITSIFEILALCNHSLNFYLHCLTSKLFRREFFQCFVRRH